MTKHCRQFAMPYSLVLCSAASSSVPHHSRRNKHAWHVFVAGRTQTNPSLGIRNWALCFKVYSVWSPSRHGEQCFLFTVKKIILYLAMSDVLCFFCVRFVITFRWPQCNNIANSAWHYNSKPRKFSQRSGWCTCEMPHALMNLTWSYGKQARVRLKVHFSASSLQFNRKCTDDDGGGSYRNVYENVVYIYCFRRCFHYDAVQHFYFPCTKVLHLFSLNCRGQRDTQHVCLHGCISLARSWTWTVARNSPCSH